MSVNRVRMEDGRCQVCGCKLLHNGSIVCDNCYHADPKGAQALMAHDLYNARYPKPDDYVPGKSHENGDGR